MIEIHRMVAIHRMGGVMIKEAETEKGEKLGMILEMILTQQDQWMKVGA